MCSYMSQEDSQDLRRIEDEHAEVRKLIRERQHAVTPLPYRILTGILGAASLLLWGGIGVAAMHEPHATLDRAYASLLGFAAVIGIGGVAATFGWLRERDGVKRIADAERIRQYHEARQVKAIRDAITVFLRDGDEAARHVMAQTQQFINNTGTDGNVHPFRGRG